MEAALASPLTTRPKSAILREAREAAGIEQYELAAVLGVDSSELSRFERGQARGRLSRLSSDAYLDALERARAIDFQQLADELGVPLRLIHRARGATHPEYIAALRRLAGQPEQVA